MNSRQCISAGLLCIQSCFSSPCEVLRKKRTYFTFLLVQNKNARTHPPQETPQFSDSILCSSALIKRVKQLQIPDEDSAGGDYYQLTYPN